MSSIPVESKVSFNFLGKTGIKVSNLCLGTMTFGESAMGRPGQLNDEESHQLINRYVEWGGNFFDTADSCLKGPVMSEKVLGTWLEKQPRENFIISTKVGGLVGTDTNAVGLSRRHITTAIDNSLRRLHTDYVDLYQIHVWDDATDMEETLRTMNDLIRAGKIRHFGVCNGSGWQMQKIVDICKELGLNPCVSLEQQYSLLCREAESEAFQVAKSNGICVLPWSPLRMGILSGKVKRDQPIPTNTRVGYHSSSNHRVPGLWSGIDEQMYRVIELAEEIGKSKSPTRSVAQVALRWLLQRDVVASVIIGSRTVQQLDDNLGASSGWALTKEEMDRLDEASKKELGYPYGLIAFANAERQNSTAGGHYVQSVVC